MSRLFALLVLGLGLLAVSAAPSEAARPIAQAPAAAAATQVHYDRYHHYQPPRRHWQRSYGHHYGHRYAPPPRHHGYYR